MEIRLYTTKQVAELLHISTHHVTHLRQAGLLKGTKYGKCWVYSHEELIRFMKASEGKDVVV